MTWAQCDSEWTPVCVHPLVYTLTVRESSQPLWSIVQPWWIYEVVCFVKESNKRRWIHEVGIGCMIRVLLLRRRKMMLDPLKVVTCGHWNSLQIVKNKTVTYENSTRNIERFYTVSHLVTHCIHFVTTTLDCKISVIQFQQGKNVWQ